MINKPTPKDMADYESFVRAATGVKKKDAPTKGKKAPTKGPNRGNEGKQFNDAMHGKC